MPDDPRDDPTDDEPTGDDTKDDDWAAEIKRLRASRGDGLAEQLADDSRKEPPVE
jgi:hypothetical protein